MLRTILAVIAGYVAIGVLVVSTDGVFSLIEPGMKSMATAPPYYWVVSIVTATIYTVGGGALSALIARERARQAMFGLIVFGELMGLASTIAFWKAEPHFYALILLAVYPPAVWLGSRLRSNRAVATAKV